MIVIISSSRAERSAFGALCESKGWATVDCETARSGLRAIRRHRPQVVIVTNRLADGYSDDILAHLHAIDGAAACDAIVLMEAGTPSPSEVRQIELGASVIFRNPIRSDVLAAYVAKFLNRKTRVVQNSSVRDQPMVNFCGAEFSTSDRTLTQGASTIKITPRETLLVELLVQAEGNIVTYESLYSEILGRKFRGETSNMRVLFGKMCASLQSLGIEVRRHVQVIPKSGYRYRFIHTAGH